MGFGITQNLWGGFDFQPEGSLLSLVILFFAILTGLNFRNQQSVFNSSNSDSTSMSNDDRDLILKAIDDARGSSQANLANDPKVIVVKQEIPTKTEEVKKEELPPANPYDPYLMANNPYFSYPPEYYDDDEYEDEWDEYEEDEYEEEYED